MLGSHTFLHKIGIGDSVWNIIFGMIFRTCCSATYTKHFFEKTLSLEFFIKVSIVLLAVDINEILSISAKGVAVSWGETTILLGVMYLIGVYVIRAKKEEALVTVSGASICGSSASMAVADGIKADKNIAINVILIMSVLTVPLIPSMPPVGEAIGFNENTMGAWIGGSVDSTGAVVATLNALSVKTIHTGIVIKMLQNILIGPVLLIIVACWYRTVSLMMLWEKFPKFVLGFLITAGILTGIPREHVELIKANSFVMSEWFAAISFVLIGMEIDLRKLRSQIMENKKIFILYILTQSVDLVSTAGIAYLMFTMTP
jgi:uncharacterized membrane protein YadS